MTFGFALRKRSGTFLKKGTPVGRTPFIVSGSIPGSDTPTSSARRICFTARMCWIPIFPQPMIPTLNFSVTPFTSSRCILRRIHRRSCRSCVYGLSFVNPLGRFQVLADMEPLHQAEIPRFSHPLHPATVRGDFFHRLGPWPRSEEHTSELQS